MKTQKAEDQSLLELEVGTQQDAVERLTDAMEQAKALYKSARQEIKWAKALYKLGATRPIESSRCAMHVQTDTLRNYMLALMEYNRFIRENERLSQECN
jgi:hypothetical protein